MSGDGRSGRPRGPRDNRRSSARKGAPRAHRTGRTRPGTDSRTGRATTQEEKKPVVNLADSVVRELRSMARPGEGDILVKVFAEAAGAFATEDYREAIRLADQAKHIALRAAPVRELLGLAYYRTENWREAAKELATFRRLSGSAEQNPVIADCYRALGRPDKALEYCNEIDDSKVEAAVAYEGHIVAAGALADTGKIDDAIARLQELDLQPATAQEHHLRAWYVLADLLERKGRFTQARELFDAVSGADPELTDAAERSARLRGR